jgi:hypothetical protein
LAIVWLLLSLLIERLAVAIVGWRRHDEIEPTEGVAMCAAKVKREGMLIYVGSGRWGGLGLEEGGFRKALPWSSGEGMRRPRWNPTIEIWRSPTSKPAVRVD